MLTLLSLLGGGLLRILPELLQFLNRKTDNKHELDMFDRQIQLESFQSANRREEIVINGSFEETLAVLDAQKTALKSQMQVTGIRFVDALNFLVRPLTTYYMLAIYGLSKLAMAIVAYHAGVDAWVVISSLYNDDDKSILMGILSFWFVGRVFDKKK